MPNIKPLGADAFLIWQVALRRCSVVRKQGRQGALGRQFVLEGDDLVPLLASALASKSAKILDLFRDFDADGDGHIDRKEFHHLLRAPRGSNGPSLPPHARPRCAFVCLIVCSHLPGRMGVKTDPSLVDELFDGIDQVTTLKRPAD